LNPKLKPSTNQVLLTEKNPRGSAFLHGALAAAPGLFVVSSCVAWLGDGDTFPGGYPLKNTQIFDGESEPKHCILGWNPKNLEDD